jgi:hypothetical protein
MDLSQRLRATTEAMASQCSVPTSLWNEHSNACLDAIDEIGRQSNRAWLAETERDALDAAHKDMAGRLARMGEENERLRAALEEARWTLALLKNAVDREGWPAGWGQIRARVHAVLNPPAVEQPSNT